MATEMKLRFSAKERVLLVMTLLLAPIFLSEIYGVAVMRARPGFVARYNEMPHFYDLFLALAFSAVILVLRLVLTRAFQPLGRLILSPAKRSNPDRVERFATVLFKFLYVADMRWWALLDANERVHVGNSPDTFWGSQALGTT
jgi:hypothetical protein